MRKYISWLSQEVRQWALRRATLSAPPSPRVPERGRLPSRSSFSLLRRLAVAFLIATTTLSIAPQSVAAYWLLPDDYRYDDMYVPPNTQNHLVYACMEQSFKDATGGSTWNGATNKWHARAIEAMNAWNALGREMAFKVVNDSCTSLHNLGANTVRLGFDMAGSMCRAPCVATTASGYFMEYPCSAYCQKEALLVFNAYDYEWYGESYLWLNGQYQIYGARADFKTIIMHELGHAAGIGHSTDHPDPAQRTCWALMSRWDLKCWGYTEPYTHRWLDQDDVWALGIYADDAGPG